MPAVSKLPRLDIPGKAGAWKLRCQALNGQGRREELLDLVADTAMDSFERLSRMRTLVDVGLWEDLEPVQASSASLVRKIAGLFEDASLVRALPSYETSQREGFNQGFTRAICPGQPAQVLHLMIEAGLDLTARELSSPGHTPLQVAVRKGMIDQVRLLLAAGADPNVDFPSLESPLNLAIARFGQSPPADEINLRLVDVLLENHATLTSPDNTRLTGDHVPPLWYAVSTFNPVIVQHLLDAGASISRPGDPSVSPIFVHALDMARTSQWTTSMCESFLGIGKQLLAAGADIEEMKEGGMPALLRAALQGNMSAMLVLLDLGANPAARDSQGQTLAHHIVFNFEPDDEGMETILERIAPDCWQWQDGQGQGPLEVLEAKCKEYGMEDYDTGPWRQLIEHEALARTTPSPAPRKTSPRL